MAGIQQHTVCVICKEHFIVKDLRNTSGQRIPLVLRCGHAACGYCIHNIVLVKKLKSVQCGACEMSSPFPGDTKDVRSHFPYHMYLIGFYLSRNRDKEMAMQDPVSSFSSFHPRKDREIPKIKSVPCAECDVQNASCYCKQCAIYYCDDCFYQVHQYAKILRSHVKESMYLAEVTLKCSIHPETDLDIFCETCSETICIKCSMFKHKDHLYVPIHEKNEALLPQLKSALDCASQLRLRRKVTLKALKLDRVYCLGKSSCLCRN